MTKVQRAVGTVMIKMIKQMVHSEELKIAQLHRFGKTFNTLLEDISKREADVNKVVDYIYSDEKKHWEELCKPDDHIFTTIQRLKGGV